MTNATSNTGVMQPLGVGEIVGDSFKIFFRRFGVFFVLAFIPAVLQQVVTYAMIGPSMVMTTNDPGALEAFSPIRVLATMVVPIVFYGLTTALIVLAAYDARLGNPARIGAYFGTAVMRLIPVVLVSIVVSICIGIGAIFLVLPGLYLASLLSVAVTVTVVEGNGAGALGRSAALTKNYRWPVLGALIVLYICVSVVSMGFMFLIVPIMLAGGAGLIWLVLLISAVVFAITTGILSIGFVLIYARLREIKEGVTVQSLVEVFD